MPAHGVASGRRAHLRPLVAGWSRDYPRTVTTPLATARTGAESTCQCRLPDVGPRPSCWSARQDDERRAAVVAQLEERYSATYEVVSAATRGRGRRRPARRVGRRPAGRHPARRRPGRAATTDRPSSGSPPTVPRRAARPARGVGRLGRPRHRRPDPDAHGPGPDRLLRHPAVALARRVLPPHGHRVPRRVGPRGRAAAARGVGRRRPRIRRARTRSGGCSPTTASRTASSRRRRRRRASSWPGRVLEPGGVHRRPPARRPGPRRPDQRRARGRLRAGGRRARRRRCSTSSSSVPDRPGSRPRCTGPPRACARSSSSASRSAARPGRAR